MNISIVIPAFNESALLPATLRSIKKLRRKPDEIIVVDNGSTDNTAAIARRFGVKIVRVPTKGIGLVRQKGLEAATGDIVAFTDADTTVPPDWLSKIEHAFTKSDIVGVFGTYKIHHGDMIFKFHMNHLQDPLAKALYRLGFPMVAGANFAVMRKAAIDAGGFPVQFRMMEENEMARRLMKIGRVHYEPDIVVVTSGRRGNEGFGMIPRYIGAFLCYLVLKRGDLFSFTDIRT